MSEQTITLQVLSDKLDEIRDITLIASKEVLSIEEAVLFTTYSLRYLYRMTSERKIPHFKRGGKLFFKKSELEHWMLSRKVLTNEEIESRAEFHTLRKRS